MPRPVNPELRRARRLQIIDAALTCFAASGFDGASTAAICRTAGIGSGTFFHYFPTKVDVMVAILELGTDEDEAFFDAHADRTDALQVLLDYATHEAANAADPRAAGFLRAVVVATSHEPVAAALRENRRRVRAALAAWVKRARDQGTARTDLSTDRTISWLLALIDGFGGQVVDWPAFDVRRETAVLHDTIRRFLAPR